MTIVLEQTLGSQKPQEFSSRFLVEEIIKHISTEYTRYPGKIFEEIGRFLSGIGQLINSVLVEKSASTPSEVIALCNNVI